MPGGPKNPEAILPDLLGDLKRVFKEDLVSVALYGSAAGDEYRPGLSDINLLVVVAPEGLSALDRLAPFHKAWQKKRAASPLVLSREEMEASLDAFPLEFLNMRLLHRTLEGPDLLEGLELNPADLRLQCERELRGKMLMLRRAVISSDGREERLRFTVLSSIKAFAAIFRGVLILLGRDPAGLSSDRVLTAAAQELNLKDGAVFSSLWDLREAKKRPKGEITDLVRRYLRVIAEAARKVDGLPV